MAIRRWMLILGGAYLLLGIGFVPAINEARLGMIFPDLGAPRDAIAYRALVDWMFLFGLDLIVVGAALIYWARDPERARPLVWLAIALELVHGAGFDLYYIARGYVDPTFYVAFAMVHLVAASTGIWLLRRRAIPAAAMAG